MVNKLKKHIIILTENNEEKMKIGNDIHEQLKGNEDYINDNIILNIDEVNTVRIFIFDECKEIPKITI